jgi:hypothetical protein
MTEISLMILIILGLPGRPMAHYCGDIVLEVRPTLKRIAEDSAPYGVKVIASGYAAV